MTAYEQMLDKTLNPSHPTIYKCQCGQMWNPDNVSRATTQPN
jgi:hypothetical protein